ncbi:MAG: hypothetical protein ACLFVC_05695 [Opitutales bacterium]
MFSAFALYQRTRSNALGIGKTGSCHLSRHACAMLMHENGADIRFLSRLEPGLGHAEPTTPQIHTQVAIRKLKEIHTATESSIWRPMNAAFLGKRNMPHTPQY